MTRFDGDPTADAPISSDDGFVEAIAAALAPALVLDRELAGGAIARVFVAREVALDRRVVAKVLPPALAAGINRDRFRREIQLAAQLQHPHIVPLLAAGEVGPVADDAAADAVGSLYYTMPFIEGESLRAELAERAARGARFTSREVLRIFGDVAEALGYAHGRGVIHRDVKPGNVLLLHGHALVTDFGVAKALASSLPASPVATMTTLGMAIGTPAYMAPEQLAADPAADHRMDLYAAGLVAYELLSGASPFAAASPQATLAAQLTRVPADIATLRPDIPPALAAAVMQCLAKDPADRPATAAALLATLEAVGDTSSGAVVATNGTPRAGAHTAGPRTRSRSRTGRTIAAVAVTCVAAGGAWFARGHDRAVPAATTVSPVAARAPAAAPTPTAATPTAAPAPPALSRGDSAAIASAVEREFERAAMRHAPPSTIGDGGAPARPAVTPADSVVFRRAARAAVIDSLVHVGDRWSRYSPDDMRSLVGRFAGEPPRPRRPGRGDEVGGVPESAGDDPDAFASRGHAGAFATIAAALPPPTPGARRVVLVMLRDGTGNPALHAVAPLVDAALRTQLRALGPYELTDPGLGAVIRHEHVPDREVASAASAAAVLRGTILTAGDRVRAMLVVYDARRGGPAMVEADAPIGSASTPPALAEALAAPLARAIAAKLDGTATDPAVRHGP